MILDKLQDDVIEDILTKNYIFDAQPVLGNDAMLNLMLIWRVYFEPDLKVTCNLCLGRILNNWKELQPLMIERIKQKNLLED